jgi:rare lipoprotein A
VRAIRTLRLPAAAKLVTGAVVVTLPVAVVVGSESAVARGAQAPMSSATSATDVPGQSGPPVATTGRPAAAPDFSTGNEVSRLVIEHGALARPIGSTVHLHGRLLPGLRRAEVELLARSRRGWRTLARARTLGNGRFDFHYRVDGGATTLRVSFGGGISYRSVSAAAGKVVGLVPTIASWYYDAGGTACGFHATYGVANKTLPCGSKVTLSYGGRTVVATVDDRGPYVYGRSFDLDQNTARYLGMSGVARLYASA